MRKDIQVAAMLMVLIASALLVSASGGGTSLSGFFGGEAEKLVEKGWIVTTTHNFYNFLTRVYDNVGVFIVANPSIDTLKQVQGRIISYIYPLFIFGIVSTAAYLLLYSQSPKGRVKAKGVFIRLIFAMIIVSLTPYFTEALLIFSSTLTKFIINQVTVSSATDAAKTGAWTLFDLFAKLTLIHRTGGIDLLLLWETFLLIFNFALAARYILVTFWCMILPASLLFYVYPPTKKIGKKFIHQTFLWTFVQVGWAFAIVIVSIATVTIGDALPGFPMDKAGIACLLLMIGTPMAILGLMDWLSMGVEVIEIVNAAPLSIGALTIDEMKVERPVVTEEPALEGI